MHALCLISDTRCGPQAARMKTHSQLHAHIQVKIFQQKHYLENFVQATFDSLPAEDLKG